MTATRPNDQLVRRAERLSLAGSAIALLAAGLVLIGWAFSVEILKAARPGLVAMNPATACGFALAGLSLWLLRPGASARRTRQWGQACAGVVLTLGLIRRLGCAVGWDSGLDRWLFRSALGEHRMAPNTAAQLQQWKLPQGRAPGKLVD